jgi:hypothetical protein
MLAKQGRAAARSTTGRGFTTSINLMFGEDLTSDSTFIRDYASLRYMCDMIVVGGDWLLFFACVDYVVLLLVGSANLGHRCLHSSTKCPIGTTKCVIDSVLPNDRLVVERFFKIME